MDFGTIIGALLTVAILSFLYRDNPVYKVAEFLLVGVTIGYTLVITWSNNMMAKLILPLTQGNEWHLLIPLALGLLMFARFSKRAAVWSRLPLAVLIGSGAGAAIPAMLEARTLKQLADTVTPLLDAGGLPNFSAIIVLVGVVCTLAYFYFSHEHTGWFGRTAKLGTLFLMLFFGTTFGYTVMSRMSTLIGRIEFLLSDALKLTR
jgi:hypothetical protein